jgi:hypothetical protein
MNVQKPVLIKSRKIFIKQSRMLVWTDKSKTRFWYFDQDLTQWQPRGPVMGLLAAML